MSQDQSCDRPSETPDDLLTAELHSPLTYVDRLLHNDQQSQQPSAGRDDVVQVMLDTLTDYIVEMVGIEVNNALAQTPQPGAEGAASSDGQLRRSPRGTVFTLFEKMPASRRG
ncbi:huntingtin-interacting protein M-like [Molossus molossus]|uniref:Huntingtin-interacting protein M n=1 Tax=Molossus molossus TaxID=27622 RepID=A0A7J8J603_MOLMO|nr:huntingtin-interacting protein M-like [Molossus molossus]KAF6492253.1 hypothetical protein HJG59_006572 [Molossus molossus]